MFAKANGELGMIGSIKYNNFPTIIFFPLIFLRRIKSVLKH